jgi:O-antigen ligase
MIADNTIFAYPRSSAAQLCFAVWTCTCTHAPQRSKTMLWTIFAVLLVLWLLGIATSYTAGGLIHVLLVIALVVMVIRLFQGRRVV